MRFSGLSLPFLFASLTSLAIVTVALHLLRSRPQRIRVVSTLLWREVRAAAQPRTLWHRFHQWPSFLLILLIGSLLVVSLARQVIHPAGTSRDVVVVLDAGLSMNTADPAGKRIDAACRKALQVISDLHDADRLTIIAADPTPRILQTPEEPIGAARKHLQDIRAALEPAQSEGAIALAAAILESSSHPELIWITDVPGTEQALPAYAHRIPIGQAASNAAILHVAFVSSPADASRGDLHARVGFWGAEKSTIPITVRRKADAGPIHQEALTLLPGSTGEVIARDLSADGSSIEVALDKDDSLLADNSTSYDLPRRPPIIVAADPGIPAALKELLRALPARIVSPQTSDTTLVATTRPTVSGSLPAVCVVSSGAAIAPRTPVMIEGSSVSAGKCGEGAALSIDSDQPAHVLARAGGSPVVVLYSSQASARLEISDALFSDGATAAGNPALAICLARAIRRVCGWTEGPEPQPVGEAPRQQNTHVPGDRTASNTQAVKPDSQAASTLRSSFSLSLPVSLICLALIGMLLDSLLHSKRKVV